MDTLRCIAGTVSSLRIVFTYGGVREDEGIGRKRLDDGRRQTTVSRVKYDGLISSIQMFILLVATSSALILATSNSESKYETTNMIVLVLLMFVGMGVIFGFFNYRSKLVAPDLSTDDDGGMERRKKNGRRSGGEGGEGEVGGGRGGRSGGEWRDGEVGGGGGRRRKEEARRGSGIVEGRGGGEEGNRDEGIGSEVEGRGKRSGGAGTENGGTWGGGGEGRKGGGGRGGGGSSKVVVIGLIVFYICGSLLDLLKIIAGTPCSVSLLQKCDSPAARFQLVVHFMFHLFRVIYLGVVTLFCLRFYQHNFLDRCLVRYSLMFLQAVNLCLWFDATVHRRPSTGSRKYRPFIGRQYQCLRPTVNATNATDCSQSRFYVTVIEDLSPLVRPFTIQFTLLVANFFCQWFFSCVRVNSSSGSERSNGSSEETASSVHSMSVDDLPMENDLVVMSHNGEPEEQKRMDMEEPDEKSPLVGRGAAQRVAPRSLGFQLWLVAIIILNSLLIVFSFPVTKKSFLQYGLFFYWVSMSLAVGVGFHVSRRFAVRWEAKEFTGLDYLLLFTSTGPIAYNIFTLIAIINTGRGELNYIGNSGLCFSLFFVIFDLAQSYIQVAFSLYAGRVVAVARDASQARSAAYFRGIIFFLAVSNGALWIANTLNDITGEQMIQKNLYGHDMWIVIYNVMKPLSLFFRFNSCLLFTRVFRRRRQRTRLESERKTRDQ